MAPRPGTYWGKRWLFSPRARSGFVSSRGSPPEAGTCQRPEELSGVKTMVSSGPQLAPKDCVTPRHNVRGAPPPVTETFLRVPSAALKPIHVPSGEKNGRQALA